MTKILEQVNQYLWGLPTLMLIIGVGLFFSFGTRFIQISSLPKALARFFRQFKSSERQEASSRKAVCTALAATVGTGNVVGVAGAIALGGPGAVFWMWVCAFLGMVIKYAEATLAVRFRQKDASGTYVGGPMFIIQKALSERWSFLAGMYSFLGIVAALGVGNATQINAAIGAVHTLCGSFQISMSRSQDVFLALLIAMVIMLCLKSGAGRIGTIAQYLVPVMSCIYILMGLGVILFRVSDLPNVFQSIFVGAFNPSAVTAGAIGSAFISLRTGASRGIFTNEAGMGTAAIAHASSDVPHPCDLGLMRIVEVFVDTIVICTITALAILCSGVPVNYGNDPGGDLTIRAFSVVYGNWSEIVLSLCIILFAFATVLGWGVYGGRCAAFLFGEKAWNSFVILQGAAVIAGTLLQTGPVWLLSEIFNGLMAIPNLWMLILTSGEVFRLTKEYSFIHGRDSAAGGQNENFNQCKPLRTFSYEKVSSSCSKGKGERKKDLSPEYRSA